ncbi:hypothetical protein HYG86_13920 [Alkalicella caledoniensis]|uniref:Uncharacterized protein n=1 Tax=Alkalicella caledoniensis TaxID=2731377 RepID=A0A7G9W3L2_ALKCA|nr:hypothetical protein [Alkalicella caledoniensis]QNO13274.1 hypothetical protein HYG86_13920 [Alkalicella caledoniensis]
MEKENKLDQIPLAHLQQKELDMIKELEDKINNQRADRIYLMALVRD